MGKSIKDLNAISSIESGDKILVDRNGKGYAATVTLSKSQVPNVGGQFTMHHAAISTNISAVDGCFTTDTINVSKYKNGGTELTSANSIGRVIFDNGGEGKSHNNMPPYLVVSVWKRIS